MAKKIFNDVSCKLWKNEQDDRVKAYGSCVIDNAFAFDVKVVKTKNGEMVSFPSYKQKNGEYRDTCRPITTDARTAIIDCVLDAYKGMKKSKKSKYEDDEDED